MPEIVVKLDRGEICCEDGKRMNWLRIISNGGGISSVEPKASATRVLVN
jgi:hypothetical protein